MAQAKKQRVAAPAANETSKDAPGSPATAAEPAAFVPWQRPKGLTRRGWAILAACLLLINLPVLHFFLRGHAEANVALPFEDDFHGADLVSRYDTTGGFWRVLNGELFSPGVKNNPLWLKAKLPPNAKVEFDTRAVSPEGDIRAEIFGNGVDHHSGYTVILGGWNNSRAAILRGYEENPPTLGTLQAQARTLANEMHNPANASMVDLGVYRKDTAVRVEAPGARAELNRTYHVVLERRQHRLRWTLDGKVLLELDDPFPLTGPDHDRFGLSSAEGNVYFDNLKVTALDDQPFLATALPPSPSPGPFSDTFGGSALSSDWLVTATEPGVVRVENGSLAVQNAHNHPVWLKRPLPDNVAIDLDAWADSPDGDIKVELFGDGVSSFQGDPRMAYTASGYVLVMGGWRNSLSAIARQEEHAENRATRGDFKVVPGQRYHWGITRQNGVINWMVDGKPFLQLKDLQPLAGPGHDHFAFSGWEAPTHFAHLTIRPL